ncbi:hypothetical protein BDR26DRAFT_1009325 [Obelidium mucronatum]|nr:hypothetical protein BDR26DRAFT_1009325 [Obelidium mucronatum]
MPQIKFNSATKSLSIIPFASEKRNAFYYGNGRIKIPYSQIRKVILEPKAAYLWAQGRNTGTKHVYSKVTALSIATITRWKPDLHLHNNPANSVGLVLTRNFKYGRIFFEVPNQSARIIAERIQREIQKLLAMTGNSKVRIHYDQVKAVYVRPTEAYVWAGNVLRKKQSITSAVHTIPGRKKPDLHLYSRPRNVVGLDLVNHNKYGRIFFDVPNHPPISVAERIQNEIGLAAAIKDFHPTDKSRAD